MSTKYICWYFSYFSSYISQGILLNILYRTNQYEQATETVSWSFQLLLRLPQQNPFPNGIGIHPSEMGKPRSFHFPGFSNIDLVSIRNVQSNQQVLEFALAKCKDAVEHLWNAKFSRFCGNHDGSNPNTVFSCNIDRSSA